MSEKKELRENPDVMLSIIGVLIQRNGGYAKVSASEMPSEGFDIKYRVDRKKGFVELLINQPDVGVS